MFTCRWVFIRVNGHIWNIDRHRSRKCRTWLTSISTSCHHSMTFIGEKLRHSRRHMLSLLTSCRSSWLCCSRRQLVTVQQVNLFHIVWDRHHCGAFLLPNFKWWSYQDISSQQLICSQKWLRQLGTRVNSRVWVCSVIFAFRLLTKLC